MSAPASAATQRRQILQLIFDTPREEAFDRLTRLAAQTLRVPIALLTFVDTERQWFKSSYGLPDPWASRRQTPLTHSFCQYVVASRKTLAIPDARSDPLVQENLAIPELGVQAYLGAPLIDAEAAALGSFAVIDNKPHSWTAEEIGIITDFAAIAVLEVRLRVEIAQRAKTEEALRQAQKMEAVGRLAGGVAHDFNNFLLIIQGYSALLEDELEDAFVHEYVAQIKTAADRAGSLTRQLLAFSRKQVLKTECFDLNTTIRDFEPMLRLSLSKDIELRLDLAAHTSLIEADRTQIEQVLLNLVINARDATPPGGRIRIYTANPTTDSLKLPPELQQQDIRTWIEIQVQDSGTGIPAEVLEHIFEPFFTTKSAEEGTGLGLATAYGIVRQSGGHIWAHSTPGMGSTFHIALPAKVPRLDAQSPLRQ